MVHYSINASIFNFVAVYYIFSILQYYIIYVYDSMLSHVIVC